MDLQIIAVYFFSDEILKAFHFGPFNKPSFLTLIPLRAGCGRQSAVLCSFPRSETCGSSQILHITFLAQPERKIGGKVG